MIAVWWHQQLLRIAATFVQRKHCAAFFWCAWSVLDTVPNHPNQPEFEMQYIPSGSKWNSSQNMHASWIVRLSLFELLEIKARTWNFKLELVVLFVNPGIIFQIASADVGKPLRVLKTSQSSWQEQEDEDQHAFASKRRRPIPKRAHQLALAVTVARGCNDYNMCIPL